MTNDITRGIIKRLHDAFTRGDHAQLAACYDDQIDWTFHAPVSIFPFLGRRIGKAAVFQSLRELYAGYKIEALAMQLVLAVHMPQLSAAVPEEEPAAQPVVQGAQVQKDE